MDIPDMINRRQFIQAAMIVPALGILGVNFGNAKSGEGITMSTKEDVIKRLNSPFHKRLFDNTYQSLVHRISADGYLPESLTGAYSGMFPRTAGPYVFLMLEEKGLKNARNILNFILESTELSHMNRIPHVIGPEQKENPPIINARNPGQLFHYVPLYRLDQPNYGGAQPFKASSERLYAVDVWLTSVNAKGILTVEIVRNANDPTAIATWTKTINEFINGWVNAKFDESFKLQTETDYAIRLSFKGEGNMIWWGLDEVTDNPFVGAYSHDKPPIGWQLHKDHVTAFALDFGSLDYAQKDEIPILSDSDQPDGQYSVLLAWARYVAQSEDRGFEDQTYRQVSHLADQATDMPYMNMGWGTTATYLIRNPCFEHSREGRFWDCYDLLTQSFVAETWRELIPIAKRREDWEHFYKWQRALNELESGIQQNLTMQLGGKTIYAEMRLPDGGKGVIYDGISWVNLSPVAAGWRGANPDILDNTIHAYRQVAMFPWRGLNLLAAEWNPPNKIARMVIGKQWAWEFMFSIEHKEWDRTCSLLDFLEQANSDPIFAESFTVSPDGKISMSDPGNGEQTSWYAWSIVRSRHILAKETAS